MNPGQVVDPGKRIAHVDAGVVVVLGDKSRPRTRRNRDLINDPGVTVVVLVIGGAIEARLGLVHEARIEDVQQFERAVDRRETFCCKSVADAESGCVSTDRS